MADNYLEKRYDEVFGRAGRNASAPARPSLDTLVRRVNEMSASIDAYPVSQVQTDLIISAGKSVAGSGDVHFTPDGNAIEVSGPSAFILGAVSEMMRLKAADLGLASSLDAVSDSSFSLALGK